MTYIINVNEIIEEKGHCGKIRRITTSPAEITYLKVQNAEAHFHEHSTEFYYVLKGSGFIKLDDKKINIKKGDFITIMPGIWHQAKGELEILVLAIPPTKKDYKK